MIIIKYLPYTGVIYRYKKKRSLDVKKTFKYVSIIIISFIVIGFLSQNILTSMDKKYIIETGSTLSLNKSTNIFYRVLGKGENEVIYLSDIGTPLNQWENSITENYGTTTNYVYERTGYYPSSEKGAKTISDKIDELSSFSNKTTINQSQVIVGEGYGALLAMEYAKKYPENVRGLLLINPLCEEECKNINYFNNSVLSTFSKFGLVRLLNSFDTMKPNEQLTKYLSADENKSLLSYFNSTKYNEAKFSEIDTLKDYNFNDSGNILGDKPLLVITSNSLNEDISHNNYIEMQKKYLNLSSNSEHIVSDSSYYFQYEKPKDLAKYIQLVINRSQRQ